ncbi:MAG: hydroxyisourate hydrolase [Leptolyngbyaceae bacterium]|nr:hydroxyisourate hydrolase [Leptolyngbyaceae bacterium]
MAGKLTTHVLDTANGCPAAGMAIALWSVQPDTGEKTLLKETQTNADGRTDEPLLVDKTCVVGVYELIFDVGTYFSGKDASLLKPLFLDQVPLRFGISDASSHYHVPLLASPWSYSTYRGS